MKKLLLYILTIISIMVVGSCERDHLHYETSRYALIHVKIDWKAHTHLDPNGVSAYIFDSNGDKYSKVVLSSDPNNVYLKLPPGDYSVVFHNNSISELNKVHLAGANKFETFSIHANAATYKPKFETLGSELFVDQPNDIASYTLHNIHVDSDDIQYHYYKPNLADYKQEVSQTFEIKPRHIVHTTRIKAYVDGVEFLSPKRPKAISAIHGMSSGYHFKEEHTSQESVMEEFEVNMSSIIPDDEPTSKADGSSGDYDGGALDILDPDDEDGYSDEELQGLGYAYIDCSTFGMHSLNPESKKYDLYIRFFLYDGTYVDYHVNVTNMIKTEDTGTKNLHTIELILSAIPDGGGTPGDGSWGPGSEGDGSDGVFDPSLDDWVDVEVELPM